MARLAAEDGVQIVVATPHVYDEAGRPEPEVIRQLTAQLNVLLEQEGLNLRVLPGAEVRTATDLVEEVKAGRVLTIGDLGKYLLVELPPSGYPVFATELFFRLQLVGITPIVAHAERVDTFRTTPKLLEEFVTRGYPMQVNAGCLAGREGPAVHALALRLIRRGAATLIGSDGHDSRDRKPLLSVAQRALRHDPALFRRLTHDNPLELLKGER